MLRRNLYGIFAFVLACGILFITFARLSSLAFAYSSSTPSPSPQASPQIPNVNYQIIYPGKIMQGNFLWPIEAIRDKVWYILTKGHLKKAELALYFSDKRITSAEKLFKENELDTAISTLTKSWKYLETAANEERLARKEGDDTSVFLTKLATAALKHREIIRKNTPTNAPGEAKAQVEIAENYTKRVYQDSADALKETSKDVPINPFEGQ